MCSMELPLEISARRKSTVEETRIRIEYLIYQYRFSKLAATVTPLSAIVFADESARKVVITY